MAVTEQEWLKPQMWTGPALLAGSLLTLLLYALSHNTYHIIGNEIIDAKHVGIALFGPYLLVVELASLLLLAALVVAWHLGRPDYKP
jgi:NADH-quinone oxidoreductase subunit J